jgi:hypothetical protein
MKKTIIIFFLFQILCFAYSLEPEISGNLQLKIDNDENMQINFRPECEFSHNLSPDYILDLDYIHEIQLNTLLSENSSQLNAHTYRAWLRFSSDNFTLRIGRQKINFGPAKLLRTLRWFDTIDPVDLQKESAGVDALVSNYYFSGNQNILLWVIDSPEGSIKGNETVAGSDNYEPGFRFQFPWKAAEIGFSAHHRISENNDKINKYATDIFVDYYLGIWSEISYNDFSKFHTYTLGCDYSISVLNGFHLVAEYQQQNDIRGCWAYSVDYPISIFDQFSIIYFTSNLSKNITINWQRSYDDFSAYLFYNLSKFDTIEKNVIGINIFYCF